MWTAMGTMDVTTIHDYFNQVPDDTAYNKETKDCGENLTESANGSPNLPQDEFVPRPTW